MTKFLFENEDQKIFRNCSDEEQICIIDAMDIGNGMCERYMEYILRDMKRLEAREWKVCNLTVVNLNEIYRVRAPEPTPTPNKIDWSVFPPEFKYCYSTSCSHSYISTSEPSAPWKAKGDFIRVTRFPVFKRGTVAPEDSLLIRPEGI